MPLDVLNAAEFDSSAWMLSRCKCCVVIYTITTVQMNNHLVVRDFCWSLVWHRSELVQLCWFQLRHACILRQLPDFRLNILKVKKYISIWQINWQGFHLIKFNWIKKIKHLIKVEQEQLNKTITTNRIGELREFKITNL